MKEWLNACCHYIHQRGVKVLREDYTQVHQRHRFYAERLHVQRDTALTIDDLVIKLHALASKRFKSVDIGNLRYIQELHAASTAPGPRLMIVELQSLYQARVVHLQAPSAAFTRAA